MKNIGRTSGASLRALRFLVTTIAVMALMPIAGLSTPSAQAQETATITVRSFGPDGTTPLPFARFTVTDSDGTIYGPLEAAPPSGAASFAVDLGDGDRSFTVEESVPPSCGIAPDPVEIDSLDAAGTTVDFTTEFDDDCDRGSVSAYAYQCPAGVDPAADYGTLSAACAEAVNGVPFRLSQGGGEILTVTTGAYGVTGRAPVVDIVPGEYQLASLDDGDALDGAPTVFCLNFDGNSATGSNSPDDVAEAELTDGAVTIEIDDNRIACDFFSIPGATQDDEDDDQDDQVADETETDAEDGDDGDSGQEIDDVAAAQTGTGYIELHKAVCPAGYDDGNYFEDCHGDGVEGVEFTVDGPNGYSESGDTVIVDDPGPGIITFDDLEAGTYTIGEDVPGDVTEIFVYCSLANADNAVPFDYNATGGIDLALGEGVAVICDWYNIPVQQFETARMEFVKHTCPATFDAEGALYAELLDNCPDVTAGVSFTLTRLEDPGFSRERETSDQGRVVFDDLAPGTYPVTEAVPAGIENVVVVCTVNDGAPYAKDVANGATSFGIDGSGQQVSCDWFNIPEEQDDPDPDPVDPDPVDPVVPAQTGSIELHKAACPPGYDEGNYFEDCHFNGIAGVEFTVDGPNGYNESADTVLLDDPDEDPGPGVAFFGDLEAGTYTIGEDVPGDVVEIFVYCSLANADDVVPFDYNDTGGIDIDLGEGVGIVCDWYNIPVPQFDPAEIEVIKYACPTGYDASDANLGDFRNDCDTPTEGVTFTLTRGNFDPNAVAWTTGANGRVLFENVSPSDYRLIEDVPDEFASPVVFCSVNGGQTYRADISNGGTSFGIDGSGQQIACEWYNVPEDLRADASITIQKRLCPDGYGGSNYIADCDDALPDVTFNADGPSGYNVNATTGQQGIAFFENLAAGEYVVTELPPVGINVAVYVVGCSDPNGQVNFTYDDSTGLRIVLNVQAGQEITCNWYNIPPRKGPSGSITVYKFLCQGKTDNKYDWEIDCSNFGVGADFELQDTTGKKLVSGTTNAQGLIVFSGLENGAYELDETNGNWCHAEADNVDSAGNVRVLNGGNTDVFIYNCGAKKVTDLPSTGSGAGISISPAPGGPGHAALWSLAGGLSGLVLLFLARRARPSLVPAQRRAA